MKMSHPVKLVWLVVSLCLHLVTPVTSVDVDEKGYILYCPCMGRFGNQADHFLGALAFAKAMDRTLVLPAWVEYRRTSHKSVQVPFDTYFQVKPLTKFHRVMTMEQFMEELAPKVWPAGNRTVFCYSKRGPGGCNAKEGNPFGSFWDTYNVDFDNSEYYGPLYYNTESQFEMKRWQEKYPADQFLVMAFTGAPAQFPVTYGNGRLHKYLKWSENIESKANKFIEEKIEKPYIGIHLRNGVDWSNACQHVESSPQLFASRQCLGQRGEHGRVTDELCFPSDKTVIRQLKEAVKEHNVKTVFVATDDRDMISDFTKAMKEVKFVKYPNSDPHVDLAILGKADFYIGNCVSTFSAFAKRERDAADKPSGFWAFPLEEGPKEKEGSKEKESTKEKDGSKQKESAKEKKDSKEVGTNEKKEEKEDSNEKDSKYEKSSKKKDDSKDDNKKKDMKSSSEKNKEGKKEEL